MGNIMPPKYVYQLAPMVDLDLAVEVKALSLATGDSMSVTARQLIEIGLKAISAGLRVAGDWPVPPSSVRLEAVEYVEEYANRQLQRRRANNRDQRAAARAEGGGTAAA